MGTYHTSTLFEILVDFHVVPNNAGKEVTKGSELALALLQNVRNERKQAYQMRGTCGKCNITKPHIEMEWSR